MVHNFKIIRLGYQCNFFSTKTILTTSLATGCPTVLILSSIGCRPCLIARVSVNSGRAAIKRANTRLGTKRKLNVHKTFRGRSGSLLNVLYTFYLRPVSRGILSRNSNITYHGNLHKETT